MNLGGGTRGEAGNSVNNSAVKKILIELFDNFSSENKIPFKSWFDEITS
jgi:hypothetical protein